MAGLDHRMSATMTDPAALVAEVQALLAGHGWNVAPTPAAVWLVGEGAVPGLVVWSPRSTRVAHLDVSPTEWQARVRLANVVSGATQHPTTTAHKLAASVLGVFDGNYSLHEPDGAR